jgi:glycosyltransferase involved in cell wall biosynthesis
MQYLRCGLPVVAIDFPNLRDLVEANGCGVCVPVPADTARAIRQVEANLKRFKDNVLTQYAQNDGFQTAFGEVLKQLSGLSEMSSVSS